jgi:hypothetical protein
LLKRRQSAPDVFAKEMTVRELLDRRAGRAAQGTENPGQTQTSGLSRFSAARRGALFFGDLSFWASKKKVTGAGAAPRNPRRSRVKLKDEG